MDKARGLRLACLKRRWQGRGERADHIAISMRRRESEGGGARKARDKDGGKSTAPRFFVFFLPEYFGLATGDLPTWISAAATIVAAATALYAAVKWRSGLEEQRTDDCIGAITACVAAVGRVVSLHSNADWKPPEFWAAHNAAWDRWTEFEKAPWIYGKYKKNLRLDWVDRGHRQMDELTSFRRAEYNRQAAGAIDHNFQELHKDVLEKFGIKR